MELQHPNRAPDRRSYQTGSDRHAKRQKVSVACQECRVRKIRCDGGRPICSSCSLKKRTPDRCVYLSTDAVPSNSYVRNLEKRVHELESLKDASNNRATGDSYTEPRRSSQRISSSTGSQYDFSLEQQPVLENESTAAAVTSNFEQFAGHPSRSFRNKRHSPSHLPSQLSPPENLAPGAGQVIDSQLEGREVRSDAADSVASDPGSEESPAFLGSSSAVGFMAEVCRTFRSRDEASKDEEVTSIPSSRSHALSSWVRHSSSGDAGIASLGPEFAIPPRRIADKLLQSYWVGAHPLQPFIHRRSFMRYYNSLWSARDFDTVYSLSAKGGMAPWSAKTFHCVLNLTFALGCRFWSISNPNDAQIPVNTEQAFLTRATTLLDLNILDNPSIRLAQALLLMVQYLQNRTLSDKAWVLVGMAIRVAQAVCLHLDVDGESQEQREERRKTWCLCVLLDRMQSMTFGRPLMLGSTMMCAVPQMIDEEFLATDPAATDASQPAGTSARTAFFVYVFKLSTVTADILKLAYSAELETSSAEEEFVGYSALFKIDGALESWRDELPSFLQYTSVEASTDNGDLFLRQAHLLHHRFLHSKILLFRRVVVMLAAKSFKQSSSSTLTTVQQSMALSCVGVCTSAAEELLEVIQPHIGTQLVPPPWFTIFLIYTAGTVLAIVFITPSFQRNFTAEQMSRLHKSWGRCIQCLKEYQKRGFLLATKCLQNLKKLRPLDEAKRGDNIEPHSQANFDSRDEAYTVNSEYPTSFDPPLQGDYQFQTAKKEDCGT